MDEGMIQAQTMPARIARAWMNILHLTELHDGVERACGFAAHSQWEAVGRAAEGMIVGSRWRLAYLRAGNGERAAVDMDRHLRALLSMRRLTLPGNQVAAIEAAA